MGVRFAANGLCAHCGGSIKTERSLLPLLFAVQRNRQHLR